MTQSTKNPIPSGNILDQVFNAEKIDEAVNSDNETYTDRLGVKRFTMTGLANMVKSFLTSISGSTGASNIGLEQGGTVQQSIQGVSVLSCGAVGDGVTDDTAAFRKAVATAITLGFREVIAPAGYRYVISDEINLGGVGYSGRYGIRITGGGVNNTVILFKPAATDSVCFSIIGGHGTTTGRGISGLSIYPYDDSYNGKGTGISVQDGCFVFISEINMGFMAESLRLWNKNSGEFTEFVYVNRCRMDRSTTLINMIVDNGNPSFHGCEFYSCQMQLAEGGVGLNVISNNSNRAHPYNCWFGLKFFGRSDGNCTAIQIDNARVDSSSGFITLESTATFKSVDDSWFHVSCHLKRLTGGSSVVWDCPSDKPMLGVPAHYIFADITSSSTLGNFTDPVLANYRPTVLDTNWAESYDNSGNGIIRMVGNDNTVNGLGFVTRSVDTIGWWMGQVTDGQPWRSMTPRYNFNAAGTMLQMYSDTGRAYLSGYHTGTQVRSRVFVGAGRFSPDGDLALGSTTETWLSAFFKSMTINDNGIIPTTTNSRDIGTGSLRFKNAYLTDLNITNTPTVGNNPVGVKVNVPATATSNGSVGQWAADSAYLYICVATNTWVRSALATW